MIQSRFTTAQTAPTPICQNHHYCIGFIICFKRSIRRSAAEATFSQNHQYCLQVLQAF